MSETALQWKHVAEGLRLVQSRIGQSAVAAGRMPEAITLVAVSKTFPAEAVLAAAACGQRHFGESYVQEAVQKIVAVQAMLAADIESAASHHTAGVRLRSVAPRDVRSEAGDEGRNEDSLCRLPQGLHGPRTEGLPLQPCSPQAGPLLRPLVWHFIGPIQSNKTREIAAHFEWVHGVDREKVARRLSEQRPQALPPLNVCIQVNVSGEASKSGVSPEAVEALADVVRALPRLKLRGLMAIPEPDADPRPHFRVLRSLLDVLNARGMALDTLSMGMSGDFEIAIAEGATLVRVGSAIFGKRNYDK